MNVADFTYLLQNPNKVTSPVQTKQLEGILSEYPYFQAARVLHLKGLKNLNSFKYNNALKITAVYTANREVLFDFITSKEFLQSNITNTISGRTKPLIDTEIIAEDIPPNVKTEPVLNKDFQDKPLPQTIEDAEKILSPTLFTKDKKSDKKSDKIIVSTKEKEKHSFKEWLQLTSYKPNKKEATKTIEKSKSTVFPFGGDFNKNKNFELIDKFINSNHKIIPKEKSSPKVNIKESIKLNKKELMTETLAKVYLEQKNFKKAIQAYNILSLKYPEKSSFFANCIKAIQKSQQ